MAPSYDVGPSGAAATSSLDDADTTAPEPARRTADVGPPMASPRTPGTHNRVTAMEQILRDNDAEVADLPRGGVGFNAPKEMSIDEVRRVSVVIGLDRFFKPEELLQLAQAIAGNPSGRQQSGEGTVSISKEMVVELRGIDFDITPITDERQKIGFAGTTEWIWQIKPKSEGTYILDLTIHALVGTDRRRMEQLSARIDVKVNPCATLRGCLKEIAEFLNRGKEIYLSLAALIGAVAAWQSRRKKQRAAAWKSSLSKPVSPQPGYGSATQLSGQSPGGANLTEGIRKGKRTRNGRAAPRS